MRKLFFMILLSIDLATCARGQSTHIVVVKDTGKIFLADPVGQTYMIRTNSNKLYIPKTLNKNFQRDGLIVIFEGNVDMDRISRSRLAGIPINIEKIKKQ